MARDTSLRADGAAPLSAPSRSAKKPRLSERGAAAIGAAARKTFRGRYVEEGESTSFSVGDDVEAMGF